MADAIRRRIGLPPPERALRTVKHRLDPAIAPLALWTLTNAYRRPSIEKAASVFRVSRKTVSRALRRFGFPKYAELRTLGQVLHVLEARARYGLSARQAARRLGLSDGSTISRYQERVTRFSEGIAELSAFMVVAACAGVSAARVAIARTIQVTE